MKNKECNIVRDLLPLYVEDIISQDSRKFVEEHISQCDECKKELEQFKADIPINQKYQETEDSTQALKKIRKDIKKKRVFTGVLSAAISTIIVILIVGFLTAPEYLSYTDSMDLISVDENDGEVTLYFTGEYELSQDEEGVYSISLYNTEWNELFDSAREQKITVNPNGDEIKTIYYVSNGNQQDEVIYGENPYANGGSITMPRLFLNYYLILAVVVALILTVLYFIYRKKEKYKLIIVKTLFIPLAYIISHILIIGLKGTSYSATRDFYLILLLTIPVYFAFYIVYKKMNAVENAGESMSKID